MSSLKFIINIYAGLSKTSNGLEWTFSTEKDDIHTVEYISKQEHDMIVLEKDNKIEELEDKIKLAVKTLEKAKEEIEQSTYSNYWNMGKEYLAKEHIEKFGPKYIDETIKEIEDNE